jgi:hypothetical protein
MNAEISALNENITAITSQRATLQTQAASDQTQITADQGNITALVSQSSMLQTELSQANGNNTDLQLKVTSLTSQIQSLDATVGVLNSSITTLNSQITTLTAETVTLTTQATQLQTQETQLQTIVALGNSQVEQTSRSFQLPAANETYSPEVQVVNFTAQYSGYVSIIYSDATNTTFTGPLIINDFSSAVSSPTYAGLFDGPFLGLFSNQTLVVPVAPGSVTVFLVNFVEAPESANVTVTYYW